MQKTDEIKKAERLLEMAYNEPIGRLSDQARKIGDVRTITLKKALNLIDTSFESFFNKRAITHQNFNLLIKVAGEQRRIEEAINAFEKMTILGIEPSDATYANLINALAKNNKYDDAMRYFEGGIQKFGPNLVLYSSALFTCARSKNTELAENIWTRATKVEGIKVDCAFLTTMISMCYFNHQIKRCWSLFEDSEALQIKPDDVLLGLMIKVCAKSKSAEKAKLLFEKIKKIENIRFTAHHYDALILALASRKDYAEEALQKYEEMKVLNIEPTRLTFIAVLEATSKIGDINTAYNAIVQMNALNIRHNNQTYDGMLKTYASALSFPNIPKKLKELYIADAWEIFNKIVSGQNMTFLKTPIINSMLLVHINGDQLTKAEESILPLFEKFNIEKNGDTFSIFIKAFFDKRNLPKVRSIFDNLLKSHVKYFTTESLNCCLDSFIRMRDVQRVIQVFNLFADLQRQPEPKLIEFLADMKNLPDELYEKLRSFPHGEKIMSQKIRTYFPVSDFEKDFELPKSKQRNAVK